jgi:hypothetical protein
LAFINELDKSLVSKNPLLGWRGSRLRQGKCRMPKELNWAVNAHILAYIHYKDPNSEIENKIKARNIIIISHTVFTFYTKFITHS